MRWRTDGGARRALEWTLRGGALLLLGWLLARELSATSAPGTGPSAVHRGATTAALAQWTLGGPEALHVRLDSAPSPERRDWLRALARSGRRVGWSGQLAATALAVEPAGGPEGGWLVTAAAPRGADVLVADAAGPVDSLRVRGAGIAVRMPAGVAPVIARVGPTVVTAAAPDSAVVRGVVVLGRPAWETRFVAAALEEAGWPVSLRVPLAPGAAVEQGSLALDTARVGLVIALDSTAAPHADAIARFVRGGGGAVLASAAVARVPALARLAAGGVGASTAVTPEGDSTTRDRLPLRAVVLPRADAIALERRGGAIAVAARRVDAGRVAQVGYDETWRWRMAGGDSGAVAHRRWWSALAASVAYVPTMPTVPDPAAGSGQAASGGADSRGGPGAVLDPAPLASLVHALGPASPVPAGAEPDAARGPSSLLLLAIAFTMLLAEWLSRRLRGAP